MNNYQAEKGETISKEDEKKYGKKAFMITKEGEVLKTSDDKMEVYPNEREKENYFVYDEIHINPKLGS